MISESDLKNESPTKRFSGIFKLSGNEIVYAVVLTVLLAFFTTAVFLSTEVVRPSSSTYPIIIEHYGFPFDSLKKIYTYHNGTIVWKGQIEPVGFVESTLEIAPLGLVLNLLAYGSLSLVIVKVVSKIKEEIYYRGYSD